MTNEIAEILKKEELRQRETIELIASENFTSEAVQKLSGSIFTNKYAEGRPGKRWYNGCQMMDEIELHAEEQAEKLFDAAWVDVQPHSGANANLAVMTGVLNPGDTFISLGLSDGGHLSHGASVNISGQIYHKEHYGLTQKGNIDYEHLNELANLEKPQMIIAGGSAFPLRIDYQKIRNIADKVNAFFLFDMAHYSGLVAGGVYPNPLPWADVVTSTTHKTLRGPRGGMILSSNKEWEKRIKKAVFPGTQGGPLMNQIAAKAQCFSEALRPAFKKYANRVIENARIMVKTFNEKGIKAYPTDSHIVLLDLTETGLTGKWVANFLETHGFTVNKNSIPGDKRSPFETSGIRIGTAAETTRGMTPLLAQHYASKIASLINNKR